MAIARRRRRTSVLIALAGVVVVAGAALASPSAAAPSRPPVDRVLVISLPAVSWADLQGVPLPHLRPLLDQSAVASLSVRAVRRATTAGDGYATIGAGTRASGLPGQDGLAFDPGELYSGASAAATFTRRVGRPPGRGPFVLAADQIRSHNADGAYSASVGALGQALEAAGIGRAVVVNGDRVPAVRDDRFDEGYGREAALALADPFGRVSGGRVGAGLLERRDDAPFGRRLDHEQVVDAFGAAWRPRSVVLVEASDLARLDAERASLAEGAHALLLRRSLGRADALVGRLLRHVDRRRAAVIVVSPYHRAAGPHLTIAAVRAPGTTPGMLDSPTTRRVGFVSIVDVGPTVLDLLGVEAPSSMAGRPMREAGGGGSPDSRRHGMVRADEAARFRDRMLVPVTATYVGLVAALLLVGALALGHGGRLRRWASAFALVVLAFLPSTYLAGLLPLDRWGTGAFWAFLAGASSALAGLARVVGWHRQRCDALVLLLAAMAGLLVVDAVSGAPLQLNTVFGYSPIQGGRFAGLPNVAFAQLAAAAILLVGLVSSRVGGARGAAVGAGVLLTVVVVDGMPMWGADVGGVLSLVPAGGVVLALMFGLRPRARSVILWLGTGVLVTVAVGFIDLARPTESRTHLGRLLESVGDEGWAPLRTVVVRKLEVNLAAVTNTPWLLMVPVMVAFTLWVVRRTPGSARAVWAHSPELRASLVGLAVAATLGFALNDSGIAVPGAMAGVASASFVHLAVGDGTPEIEGRRRPPPRPALSSS